MASTLVRLETPVPIVTRVFGTPSAAATSLIRAAFAAPSTGRAATRTWTTPSRTPSIRSRPADGVSRTTSRAARPFAGPVVAVSLGSLAG